jgi:hypothetical protein
MGVSFFMLKGEFISSRQVGQALSRGPTANTHHINITTLSLTAATTIVVQSTSVPLYSPHFRLRKTHLFSFHSHSTPIYQLHRITFRYATCEEHRLR